MIEITTNAAIPPPGIDLGRRGSGLGELVRKLESLGGPADLATLEAWLGAADPSVRELRPYLRFDPGSYRRNLVHRAAWFEVLVLCWRTGQHSPIHDHRGSRCAVAVLAGVATELRFVHDRDGAMRAESFQELPAGSVTASEDEDRHLLANWSKPSRDLVTLHVYSPPLQGMQVYPDSAVAPASWKEARPLPSPPVQNRHRRRGEARVAQRAG